MIKQGIIVLIPFPFTDLSGDKLRPALVVSNYLKGDDIIVVFISSKKPRKIDHLDVVLEPDKVNSLKTPSIIKCSKIATLDQKIILGELGFLSAEKLKEVKNKLKIIFNL